MIQQREFQSYLMLGFLLLYNTIWLSEILSFIVLFWIFVGGQGNNERGKEDILSENDKKDTRHPLIC